jgi:hypothetical protein
MAIRPVVSLDRNHWVVRAPALIALVLVSDLLISTCVRQTRINRAVRQMIDAELTQEPYRDADWAHAYWNEVAKYQEQWDPYIVYRVRDLPGPLITVTNGVRRTYSPAADGTRRRLIFVLGGSAAWGHGVRDENTLPSWLAKVAEEHGEVWDVRNYAESGWVNWQGIVYLLQKLADGERPDVVIFYSGVNELRSARYWPTVRRPLWNADTYPTAMSEWVLQKDRPVFRTWDYYRKSSLFFGYLTGYRDGALPLPSADSNAIVRLVQGDYLADKAVVENLGRAYGFRTVFAWQVTVAAKEHLTAQERRYAGWLSDAGGSSPALDWWAMPKDTHDLYQAIGRHVTAQPAVADLTDAFAGVTSTAFIDWMHPTESGNEHVGRALHRWITTPRNLAAPNEEPTKPFVDDQRF